ncbi:60S acidic ribosomal protein [Nitzschia inconspicua]|uniref:60S acidic ribosomal protein n=1 Tax=Nitzschia inconspicua TaxID=303405 RepID=A0A9K3KIQ2_9STRA|nr:60S acidic ribosomal protein [Nitzschia inconspicua]KAG7343563.1 60S acidic ribosomal protein [Nitzschia inconspicua]
MKELAVYMMLVLGGNAAPSKDDVTTALSAVGLEADSSSLDRLLGDLEGKDLGELMASGKEMLAKFGGGGGGGGGGAGGAAAAEAEEKAEEKVEEEEMEVGGGGDLFGGGDAGGGGDY